MSIDFFADVDAEFLIERLQVRREIKIGIDALSGVFRCRHRMHSPRNAEPSLFAVKGGDAVPALKMHDRDAPVRGFRRRIAGRVLAAEWSKRSLVDVARAFL